MKRARICILLALTLVFVMGFGSTALANPCPIQTSYSASYQCETAYTWSISKDANPKTVELGVGESQPIEYIVTAQKAVASKTATSTITGAFSMTLGSGYCRANVKAYVKENESKIGSTEKIVIDDTYGTKFHDGDSWPYDSEYTPDPAKSYQVVYEGWMQWWSGSGMDIESEDIDVTYNVDVSDTPINGSINIQDVMDASGLPSQVTVDYTGQTWSDITDSGQLPAYIATVTNNGNKSASTGDMINTATALNIEGVDPASVTVTVTTPKVSKPKPPEPREERKVRWPDRTPPPEELESASVELPKTGGFIEWEWLALAGGMIASGGGALYLVRRRKMKK